VDVGAEHQGVAIRGGARHLLRPDDPVAARAVQDNPGLAEHRTELLGEDATDRVDGTAGSVGDDQVDRARVLRRGPAGGADDADRTGRSKGEGQGGAEKGPSVHYGILSIEQHLSRARAVSGRRF
jgi:hypothetical protein